MKIHGKERVSSLFISSPEEIFSVGRDGRLCTYRLTSNSVELASTGKIRKGIDNTEKLYSIGPQEDHQMYVVGFYGGKLVVEGLDIGAQLLSIECGGLHRPHHFKFIASNGSTIPMDPSYYTCTFLQRKHIHVHQSSLLHDKTSQLQQTFQSQLHGLQVNVINFIGKKIIILIKYIILIIY